MTKKKIEYNIDLYKIKIDKKILQKYQTTIKIKLIDKEINKFHFEYIINITDKYQNIFLYDIDFKKANNIISFFYIPLPSQYNLTTEEKYEIFRKQINVLDDDEKDVDGKYKESKIRDLIYYTLKKIEKDKQYNISFFISLFNEINSENELAYYLQLFDLNKVVFDDKKLNQPLNIRKIKMVIILVEVLGERKEKENIINNILLFLLLLIYKCEKSINAKIFGFFGDKYILDYVFQILLEDKNKPQKEQLFPELTLCYDLINSFIVSLKNYKDILNIISYNHNFFESLKLLNANFEFIIQFFKNEMELIKLDKFITPKPEDDLINIKKQLVLLINSENKFGIKLVDISPKLLLTYFELNENNADKLVCLYQITKMIWVNKGKKKYFKILENIHSNLGEYALQGKLKNMNLLIYLDNSPLR